MQVIHRPVSLTNDGRLWVFFLGCGSAFSKKLFQNNLLFVKGENHLLVDCGSLGSRALVQAGLSITDIRNILPTHSHADHIGGLEEMALMNRYVLRSKPTIYIQPAYQKILWNQSLRGGSEMSEFHNGKGLAFTDFWKPVRPARRKGFPRDAHEFSVGDLRVTIFRTRHYPEQAVSWKDAMYSIGLVVDDRVFFSGDTQYDPDLIPELTTRFTFEALFHDVQLYNGGIHASLDQISALPDEIKSKTYLMHYGDDYENHRTRIAQSGFAGFVQQQVIYAF